MKELTLFSPAKINLFLHIMGKRADGYHDLQSVFRALDFGDTLTFRPKNSGGISLFGAESLTPEIDDNLIIKAATTLSARFPAYASSVQIILDKHIPTGAGLGGGSSNAATTLIALNELWGLKLSLNELLKIASTLGADVPFFVFAHLKKTDAIATGIGDVLHPTSLPKRHYLLVMPETHISTKLLFAHPKLPKATPAKSTEELQDRTFDRLDADFFNAFETLSAVHAQSVATALSYLKEQESKTHTSARLTGTGSAVFLPLIECLDTSTIETLTKNAPYRAILTSSLHNI